LKNTGYERNFDRITDLENLLNDASEKYISDRLSNYVKSDVLNSEKKRLDFLKLLRKMLNLASLVYVNLTVLTFRTAMREGNT
jgi:hypothetical protein